MFCQIPLERVGGLRGGGGGGLRGLARASVTKSATVEALGFRREPTGRPRFAALAKDLDIDIPWIVMGVERGVEGRRLRIWQTYIRNTVSPVMAGAVLL
jgi:hypothetical protein